MRTIRIIILFILISEIISSCIGESDSINNPNKLVVAIQGNPRTLMPVLASETYSGEVSSCIFNGLTKYDKDLKVTGDLAEAWDVSDDGLVVTFHLRKNVKWHDGEPFTSADVLFTYETVTDPDLPTAYGDRYGPVNRVELVDKHTVKVVYNEPYAPSLESWNMGIIPKHILEGKDILTDNFNIKPIGTGPYRFVEWLSGEKVVLSAFKEYFEDSPKIENIEFRIIHDEETIFRELRTGYVDLMHLSPEKYAKVRDDEDFNRLFNVFKYPAFGYTFLGFNLNNNNKFSDKRVRQAISYAIDEKSIIENALLGQGMPITGPFLPTSWAYNPDVKGYPYSPQIAESLFAEAGWIYSDDDGILEKDGVEFSFTILTVSGLEHIKKTGEMIQKNLENIGINVMLKELEWQDLLNEHIALREFDALIMGWGLAADPDVYDIWHSSKTKPSEFNYIGYSNPEVDSLLIKGSRTFDQDERARVYNKIHAILSEDAPYTFLYVPYSLTVLNKRFHGVRQEPAGIWYNYTEWYIQESNS